MEYCTVRSCQYRDIIMNIIKIDTSNNIKTKVELQVNGKTHFLQQERKAPGDQNVLELIEKLIKSEGITLKDIQAMEVNTGPGSYTGLRVGVSIANALAFGMQVVVNGKPLGEDATPTY